MQYAWQTAKLWVSHGTTLLVCLDTDILDMWLAMMEKHGKLVLACDLRSSDEAQPEQEGQTEFFLNCMQQ